MKHDELLKLTKEQLNARLKEIGVSARTAEGDALDALLAEAQDIRDILDQAKKREQLQEFADRQRVRSRARGKRTIRRTGCPRHMTSAERR